MNIQSPILSHKYPNQTLHPFKYPFVLNQSLEQRKINFGFQILILILETGPGGIAHKYPNQTCGPFRRSPLF